MIANASKYIVSKLGACPKCMRQSFHSALVAWTVVPVAFYSYGWSLALLIAALAVLLSMLWLAHLGAYAYRITMASARPHDQMNDQRRTFVTDLIKAFVEPVHVNIGEQRACDAARFTRHTLRSRMRSKKISIPKGG
jgi:hypothetical protein